MSEPMTKIRVSLSTRITLIRLKGSQTYTEYLSSLLKREDG